MRMAALFFLSPNHGPGFEVKLTKRPKKIIKRCHKNQKKKTLDVDFKGVCVTFTPANTNPKASPSTSQAISISRSDIPSILLCSNPSSHQRHKHTTSDFFLLLTALFLHGMEWKQKRKKDLLRSRLSNSRRFTSFAVTT